MVDSDLSAAEGIVPGWTTEYSRQSTKRGYSNITERIHVVHNACGFKLGLGVFCRRTVLSSVLGLLADFLAMPLLMASCL